MKPRRHGMHPPSPDDSPAALSRPETAPPANPDDLKGLPIEEAARLLRERHPGWWFVDGGPQSPWFACPRDPANHRRGVVAYTAATLSRRIADQDQQGAR